MDFHKTNNAQGFTLIELMMVVSITVILASIAEQSYSSYAQQSIRSYAINALLTTQRAYELSYANNGSYIVSPPALPSNTSYYSYSVSATATTYTLTATAVLKSTQASDTQGSVACNVLTISNLNNRWPQDCWNAL